ncbi:hypothetical protein Fmac_021258 [Flemingia macrophylla]|uniref:Secreted protein n=1 Tax=Flemingia macrophylla TaxID=520843 RepID=A0ABD1LWI6_9FABA
MPPSFPFLFIFQIFSSLASDEGLSMALSALPLLLLERFILCVLRHDLPARPHNALHAFARMRFLSLDLNAFVYHVLDLLGISSNT